MRARRIGIPHHGLHELHVVGTGTPEVPTDGLICSYAAHVTSTSCWGIPTSNLDATSIEWRIYLQFIYQYARCQHNENKKKLSNKTNTATENGGRAQKILLKLNIARPNVKMFGKPAYIGFPSSSASHFQPHKQDITKSK